MKQRIESVKIIEEVGKGVRKTKDDMIGWQKEQMYAGKKKTGGNIRPPYKPSTKAKKKKKGQPTDRVTLKDTGAFYDGMIVDAGADRYNITSENKVTSILTSRYGDAIFGLGGVFKKGYCDQYLQPAVVKSVKKILKV